MNSVTTRLEEQLKKDDFVYWLEVFGSTDDRFIEQCVTDLSVASVPIENGDDLTVNPKLAHWGVEQGIEYARQALSDPAIYLLGDERLRKVLHVAFGMYPSLADEFEVFGRNKEWLSEQDAEGISVAHVLVQYSEEHAKRIISEHHDIAFLASKPPFNWKVVEAAVCSHENLSLWLLEEEQRLLALHIGEKTLRKDRSNVFFDISTRFLSAAEKIQSIPEIRDHKNVLGQSVEDYAKDMWHAQGFSLKTDSTEELEAVPSHSGFTEALSETTDEEGIQIPKKRVNRL